MTEKIVTTQVCVIGGGASGMFAAISAAQSGAKVTILESNTELGKKLYATGNGKCNLLNLDQSVEHFHGEDDYFIRDVLSEVSVEQLLILFRDMGIMTYERDGGYLYPRSEQAASVVSALLQEIERWNIRVYTGEKLRKLTKMPNGNYELISRNGLTIHANTAILCTGGSAAPKTGSDGSGYYYAKQFGHGIHVPVPALCQLCLENRIVSSWAGVRLKGNAAMIIDDVRCGEDYGELMFTNYGISGIPIFQISYLASFALQRKQKAVLELDLFPDMSEEELVEYWMMMHARYPQGNFESMNNGILPAKMITALCEQLDHKKPLNPEFFWNVAAKWKHLRYRVTDTTGFEHAQVSAGGISTKDIDSSTMESKRTPGLYFAGEVLDFNGDCGGYNLQWAWSTGYLAGKAAAMRCVGGKRA